MSPLTVVVELSVVLEGRDVDEPDGDFVDEGTVATVGATVPVGTPGPIVVAAKGTSKVRRGPVVAVVLVTGTRDGVVGSARNQFGIRITASGTRAATVTTGADVAIVGTDASSLAERGAVVVTGTVESGTVGL